MKSGLIAVSLLAVVVCAGCTSPVNPPSPERYGGTWKVDGPC